MKKIFLPLVMLIVCLSLIACGSNGKLKTPSVKDGVTTEGEEAIQVRFDWDKIEGAEGYEISEENKYCKEEAYREAEYSETTDNFFTCGAQDDFDFRIKVRAYKGTGEKRQYSEWSEYATGSTYNKE
ncbi:MAG: hypothetical protein IJU77_01600 [Butyrivibrio sp.]|nr:hypothetical protein [Butyrivibrio sp.]